MKDYLRILKKNGDKDLGFLSFFEANNEIPFSIKRIYYIYEVPIGAKRGMHAHKLLDQVLWCPYGKIRIVLDNGEQKEEFILESQDQLLIIPKGIWHDMFWEIKNSVLCVAASDYYLEEDYIRNYSEFLKYTKEGYWKNGK